MRAKLIFINVLASNPDKSAQFYGDLMGAQGFARSLTDKTRGYHMPISSDGIDLNITGVFEGQPPRIIPFFAVDDRHEAVERLSEAGGKAVAEVEVGIPKEMFEAFRRKATASRRSDPDARITDKLGDATLMLDPDKNPVGLMTLEPFVHEHFGWGKYRKPLDESQVQDHITSILVAQDVFYAEKTKRG